MKSRLVLFSDKSAVSETCKTETLLKSYRLVPLIPAYQALALITHTHTLRVTENTNIPFLSFNILF